MNATLVDHDLDGNMTAWNGWTYAYDIENRLRCAQEGGSTVVTYDKATNSCIFGSSTNQQTEYTYDPLGRLATKVASGALTQDVTYLYDGLEPIQDVDTTAQLVRRYVNGAGVDERVQFLKYDTTTGSATGDWEFYTDHQGSVIAMAANTYTWKAKYDEYGKLVSGGNPSPFGYTGRRLDATTGLYYYRVRFYNPDLGRFLTTDPIGYKDDMNMYAYVGGDPMNGTDPTGEFVWKLVEAAVNLAVNTYESASENGGLSNLSLGDVGDILVKTAIDTANPAGALTKLTKIGSALNTARKSNTTIATAGNMVKEGAENVANASISDKLTTGDSEVSGSGIMSGTASAALNSADSVSGTTTNGVKAVKDKTKLSTNNAKGLMGIIKQQVVKKISDTAGSVVEDKKQDKKKTEK